MIGPPLRPEKLSDTRMLDLFEQPLSHPQPRKLPSSKFHDRVVGDRSGATQRNDLAVMVNIWTELAQRSATIICGWRCDVMTTPVFDD